MILDAWCRLTLLGELRVTSGEGSLVVGSSAQRLLAVMAVVHRARRVRRTTVAERLWPEATGGRATANLRSTLWRLPRPRGRVLVRGDATAVWLDEGVDVDLWRAEELAHRLAGPDALSHADGDLAPLRDDLLPDWAEEWLFLEQESYRQVRLRALETGASVLCREGRFAEALEAAMAAVQAEPLRESAHRRVIEVHLAEGNPSEALRQYDGYRRLLSDELGLRPTDNIRHLVHPLLGRPVDHADDEAGGEARHADVRGRFRATEWPLRVAQDEPRRR